MYQTWGKLRVVHILHSNTFQTMLWNVTRWKRKSINNVEFYSSWLAVCWRGKLFAFRRGNKSEFFYFLIEVRRGNLSFMSFSCFKFLYYVFPLLNTKDFIFIHRLFFPKIKKAFLKYWAFVYCWMNTEMKICCLNILFVF